MVVRNITISVFTAVILLTSFNVFAQEAIKTKEFTCIELQELLAVEKQLSFKVWLGATPVYSGLDSCDYFSEPVSTGWRTKDTNFCAVGYTCKLRQDGNLK